MSRIILLFFPQYGIIRIVSKGTLFDTAESLDKAQILHIGGVYFSTQSYFAYSNLPVCEYEQLEVIYRREVDKYKEYLTRRLQQSSCGY